MELMQQGRASLGRRDLFAILFVIFIAFAIYYPVFYSEYLYTDESVQLWMYKKGSGFQMFIGQGRYVTEKLFQLLFSRAHSVHDVIYIRLFSFFGWIVCIPVWYLIIRKIVHSENLPRQLVFVSLVYLISMPPFCIYVVWASCLEQFIAATTGLVSGYMLYSALGSKFEKPGGRLFPILLTVFFGVVSLFTYQNGFGCFLIPFVLHFISNRKISKKIFIGIGAYLSIYLIYYFLFKYNLEVNGIEAASRTRLSIDFFPKLRFFFARPLATAFHFTYLFNEKSMLGIAFSMLLFVAWIIVDFYQLRSATFARRVKRLFMIVFMLALVYLPSLIVKEMYSSNRTLFALNMAVFFLITSTFIRVVAKEGTVIGLLTGLSFLFVLNARNNLMQEFLNPIKIEYKAVRSFIEARYKPGVTTVYFIRPHEDFFVHKYRITRSWDEFGVPSTFFDWVPEFFTRQVIFEKTRNRKIAEALTIKHWLGREEFVKSSPPMSANIMIIDVEEILSR